MIIVIKLCQVQLAIFTMYSYATQGTNGSEQCETPLGVENGQIPDSAMSASSQWNDDWGPRQGRLNNQNRCWTTYFHDLDQWLQIDLGNVTKITGLATQGCKGIVGLKAWVKTYTLSYSVDCGHFEPYNGGQVFDGNTNDSSPKRSKLNPPIQTRCIRVKPKTWEEWPVLRVELYGCEGGNVTAPQCMSPLGLQNGSVLNSAMSASSEFKKFKAYNGRLHFQGDHGAWCAEHTNVNQWLQVDFKDYVKIRRVSTQGIKDHVYWVIKYRLSYSYDGIFFQDYTENLHAKDFSGNSYRYTVVSHLIDPPIITRFIRINPTAWHTYICMRAELFGCRELQPPTGVYDCISPLGIENGQIPDSSFSASSSKGSHKPKHARLNHNKCWKPDQNTEKWLQVDLGNITNITGIATQGCNVEQRWVKSYSISFSRNGSRFDDYENKREFKGNIDHQGIVSNILEPRITSRYIRIHPKEWNTKIGLRFELYGCHEALPRYQTLGCFQDTGNRAIPPLEGKDPLLDGIYYARQNPIEKCYQASKSRGYKVFAVQHGGWCASSATAEQTYNKYGPSSSCGSDGEGGLWANQVYEIQALPSLLHTLGCFKDTSDRAIPILEGQDPILDEPYKARQNAVEKCYQATKKRGFKVFAVQDGGQCFSSATAELTYNKHGPSNSCKSDGKGGGWANQVYEIQVNGNWAGWAVCDRPCGTGTRTRVWKCVVQPCEEKEKESCSTEECPAVQVMYTVRLIDETWKEDLDNVTSDARKEMMEMIKTNVKKEDYENSIDKVTITNLREGSVIATFNVTYRRLNSIQLLAVQESLANKRLGDVPAELIDVITDNVPNQKPNITEALPNDSTSINITWSSVSPNPNGAPLLGYSIYYRRINKKYRPDVLQTVQADVTTITLKNLEKFTKYAIRVLAFTKNGNGLCSKRVFVWTDESVPSRPPPNVEVFVHSSTKMTVTWDDIDRTRVHGILRGYKVSYRSHKESENPEWKKTTLSSSTTSLVLKGLQKFTDYSIAICAYTSKGCGVKSEQVKRTREDAPSMPPQKVTVESFLRSIRINWDPFPEEYVHGVLLGFKLTYKLIRASGLRVRDTKETLLTLGPQELSAVLQDLRSSSAYKIKLAAFTAMGTGPYSEHIIAETCRCPKVLYTNYWAHPPYFRRLKNGKVEGIFPKILKDMVRVACGKCSSASVETSLNMTSNGHDKDAFKSSLTTVLRDIDEVPQIHFPINGNKYITKYMGNYSYVYLVESPGVVFVAVSDPPSTHASILFRAALNVGFSLGILVLCSTIVSGFLFWMLERKSNPQEFSPSFFRGICDGMWWSFVSMTTVGYGDKNACTFIGRCFAIAWTLIGLVNMSMVVSSISTELTTIAVSKDTMIYGSKVATIHNSTEHRLGILMNAVVNKDRQYRNIKEIHRALETREVQGALVDTYVAAEHREELFTEGVRVNRVLDKPFGYGIVLSGAAANAKKYFDDYIKNNIHTILHIIENDTSILPVPEKSIAEETSAGLFDSSSSAFQWTVKVVGGILALATLLGLVWHYGIFLKQNKEVTSARAQMEGQIKEMLQMIDKLYKATNELKQIQKQRIREFLKRHKKSSRTDQHSSPQTELRASPVPAAVVCESRDTSRELVASEIQKSFWDGENFIEEINFMTLSKIPNIGQRTNNKQERQVDYELVDVKSS